MTSKGKKHGKRKSAITREKLSAKNVASKKDVATEDSGPRHPRKRGLLATERRKLSHATIESEGPVEGVTPECVDPLEEGPLWVPHPRWEDTINEAISPVPARVDPLVDYGESDVNSSSPPHEEKRDSTSSVVEVRKGAGGHFVSRPHLSVDDSCLENEGRKHRRINRDDSWRVTTVMPGGPFDGSVIPSFGGHVATLIWEVQ
ncbi:hypothetical protein SOVF_086600 [Spinacia oleracea]|nr:hypothetical protein SOVF_086600 [Spinacia oleracea]